MTSTALLRPDTEIAQRMIAQDGPISVQTSLGTISLRMTRDLQGLKGLWEAMQAAAPCTAAQTYDWAQAWTKTVLGPAGREPAVAVGYGADGAALFL